jgi:hypothetical protein
VRVRSAGDAKVCESDGCADCRNYFDCDACGDGYVALDALPGKCVRDVCSRKHTTIVSSGGGGGGGGGGGEYTVITLTDDRYVTFVSGNGTIVRNITLDSAVQAANRDLVEGELLFSAVGSGSLMSLGANGTVYNRVALVLAAALSNCSRSTLSFQSWGEFYLVGCATSLTTAVLGRASGRLLQMLPARGKLLVMTSKHTDGFLVDGSAFFHVGLNATASTGPIVVVSNGTLPFAALDCAAWPRVNGFVCVTAFNALRLVDASMNASSWTVTVLWPWTVDYTDSDIYISVEPVLQQWALVSFSKLHTLLAVDLTNGCAQRFGGTLRNVRQTFFDCRPGCSDCRIDASGQYRLCIDIDDTTTSTVASFVMTATATSLSLIDVASSVTNWRCTMFAFSFVDESHSYLS